MSNARFLLATWDGGGHAAPMLSIARALARRGHDVRVLADPCFAADVRAAGAHFVPWRHAPHTDAAGTPSGVLRRERDARSPKEQFEAVRDGLICGPAADFARDTLEELRRAPADVVVADHMLPGVLIGAEAARVRRVAVAMSFLAVPDWGVPAMGQGLRTDRLKDRIIAWPSACPAARLWSSGLPAINRARTDLHLDPIFDPVDMFGRHDLVLVASSAAVEFPGYRPPEHVRFVGPRLDDPVWADAWTPPPGDAPLVLASLSTGTMAGARETLDRITRGLGDAGVRGVVTTGPHVDPRDITPVPNVDVLRSAPHAAVLRHAAAIVTHAGHGTAMKALAAGVPLVCIPLGRDQHDVAARITQRGAAVTIDRGASPQQIGHALQRVLHEPRHAAAAREIAAAIAAETRTDRAVAELEALSGVDQARDQLDAPAYAVAGV